MKKFKELKTYKAYKTVVIITWIVSILILASTTFSIYSAFHNAKKSAELSPEQQTFINEILEKNQTFSIESDKVKIATQGFIDVMTNQEWSKMQTTLKEVVSATTAIQPKIDELKKFIAESKTVFTGENDQK